MTINASTRRSENIVTFGARRGNSSAQVEIASPFPWLSYCKKQRINQTYRSDLSACLISESCVSRPASLKKISKSIYYLFYCLKCQVGVKCPEIQIIYCNYLEFCCIMRETGRCSSKHIKKCDISVELRDKYQPHLLILNYHNKT